jgi:TolB-like protein/Tfp pilus assembly protein PilF
MSANTENRRLAAIMFTDMVGYSALSQRDEALALELLEEHRRVVRDILPRHGGREVKTTGDGFLIEFSSALAAVQCAVTVQEALHRRNQDPPPERQVRIRIGIHVGDVVLRDGDIHGDGVNIAARIEPLAEPGGICITRSVFDLVQNKIPHPLLSLGAVALKNLANPVDIYQIKVGGQAAEDTPGPNRRPSPASSTGSAPAQSVAVLPFLNISEDPENEFLCDGITEELILGLSQLPGLRVPARTSAFAFKGKQADIRHIAQVLNVAHVLEGSVRKVGARLRITAQLIAVPDGFHLWSERYDRQMTDIFAIQDEITEAIVSALQVKLAKNQNIALAQRHAGNAEAYRLYLQGRFHYYQWSGEGFRRSIRFFEEAMALEPTYALAYAGLSLSCLLGWFYGHLSSQLALPRMTAAATRAVEFDASLAEAHTALGMVRFWHGCDVSGAERSFRRAIQLNPYYVTAHENYGLLLGCLKRRHEALREVRHAQELDPLSLVIHLHAGFTCWFAQDFAEMRLHSRTLIDMAPGFFGAHWLMAWTLWQQGASEQALTAFRQAVELGGGPLPLADLACVCGRSGRVAEARGILSQLQEAGSHPYVPASYIAFVHAGLGETESALAWFEKACGERHGSLMYALQYAENAQLAQLLADARFRALLEKIAPLK